MQTISLHGKVGEDGILRLEMPVYTHGEEVDVIVTVQPSRPLSLAELAGAISDETLVEPDELSLDISPRDERFACINESYGACADDPIERPHQNS